MRAIKDEKGRTLVCGIVKGIYDGRGNAAGRCVNVRVENTAWDSEERANVSNIYEIAFWNTEKLTMKSRFEKAKIKAGDFISILFHENEEFKGTAVDFKKNGLWKINEKTNVIIGVVVRTNVFGEKDKTTVATIPYSKWVPERGDTESIYVGVKFNDAYRTIQERALNLLTPENGSYKKCIIECGAITQNDRGFYGAYGRNFEMI